MRIPLDYYRILSVPVKATPEQLEQAYRDRLLQQPRREYSESAILARQKLIQHSYQVLSDSGQRAIYDAQFLSRISFCMYTYYILSPNKSCSSPPFSFSSSN